MADLTGIVRLHSLGDVVMAQPAATALAEQGPVIFFTRSEYVPVIERMPGDVVPEAVDAGEGIRGLIRTVASSGADGICDLQNSLATRLAIGSGRTMGRFRFDRHLRGSILKGADGEMPLRSIEFMEAAGVTGPPGPILERRSHPAGGGTKVGIVCGGRWPMKSIPEGIIAEVCRILIDIHTADVVLLGGPGDREAAQRILTSVVRHSAESRTGTGGIEALIGSIEELDVLISPDSGPAHLASALGVPAVVVFTSTSPALGFWSPGIPGAYTGMELVCRPCHRHGGRRCRIGTELCRSTLVPREMAELAWNLGTA